MIARFTAWLSGIAWLIGWRLARVLPEPWVVAGFERLGARNHRRNDVLRETVRKNLEPVVAPERLDRTVEEAFRWYGRYWAETFRMQDLSRAQLDARMRTEGLEHIEKAFAEGRGAVLATPHLGNWDSGGRFVAERWPLTVVVEVLKPRMVFERFVAHRRGLGMHIIPLERGGDPIQGCEAAIRDGGLVALVSDRDMSKRGIEVTLFGKTTTMPPGPAVLALRTGAPLIPAAIYQHEDGTWLGRVMEPLPTPHGEGSDAVAELTQSLASAFESLIRHAPEQWHVFTPFWPEMRRR